MGPPYWPWPGPLLWLPAAVRPVAILTRAAESSTVGCTANLGDYRIDMLRKVTLHEVTEPHRESPQDQSQIGVAHKVIVGIFLFVCFY